MPAQIDWPPSIRNSRRLAWKSKPGEEEEEANATMATSRSQIGGFVELT